MYRASHILVSHTEAVSSTRTMCREEALFLAGAISEEIRTGKYTFDQAAKIYSDCPSGKANNGNLGTFLASKMDKDFITYLDNLKPGEISGPCPTIYGFHLIRRN
jgi:parvulin-like peptidyl-prolyl isomerase